MDWDERNLMNEKQLSAYSPLSGDSINNVRIAQQ